MFDLAAIQQSLQHFNFDGWLVYDFRGSNLLGRRVLEIADSQKHSRRWLYFIPASGEPRKLVHRIEPGALDHLPGSKTTYLRWQELEQGIRDLIQGTKRIALEYSPGISNPYVSRVDAGVVEMIRGTGTTIASSGDLIQQFEATWDDDQWQMHLAATRINDAGYARAWEFITNQVRKNGSVSELAVQQLILKHFCDNGLTTYSPPIVAANEHSGDPHFENAPDVDKQIREGDFVLIDSWAKLDKPRAVYSDLTRVAFVGRDVPPRIREVFRIVAAARDAAIERVRTAFATGQPLAGWQVDDAARQVIEQAGYGEYFIHRTGHSIGQETHGNGANMDNLETHEERLVLPRTCFSIEPGIYLPEFGIRSEVNVFIARTGDVHVTGGPVQTDVLTLQ